MNVGGQARSLSANVSIVTQTIYLPLISSSINAEFLRDA